MKKILLTVATLAAFSTSALAEMNNGEYGMYVAAEAGASFFQNAKIHSKLNGNGIAENDDAKLKSKRAGAILGLGVGGYVMDNVRGELMYNYFTDQHLRLKNKEDYKSDKSTIAKAKAMSVLVNAYVDVVDFEGFKVFVGAGVGMARVKDKYDSVLKYTGDKKLAKGKTSNNFAYAVYAGTSYNLNAGTDLVLKYSFRDNGKSKYSNHTQDGIKIQVGHLKYQSHNVTLGLRFDV